MLTNRDTYGTVTRFAVDAAAAASIPHPGNALESDELKSKYNVPTAKLILDNRFVRRSNIASRCKVR